MSQDQISANIALSYNHMNDSSDRIPVLTLKLKSQGSIHLGVDKTSEDHVYRIVTTYSNSSILICDTNSLALGTASISLTFPKEVQLKMSNILQLVNTFNDYRDSSIIFVKGIRDKSDIQKILVYQ